MTCLPILSTLVWALLECSHKKLELRPPVPLVRGPKHFNVDETQRSGSSGMKITNVKTPLKPFKISALSEGNEPKPTAASLKCGRTQNSRTMPILPSDDTTKHVESLPESSA